MKIKTVIRMFLYGALGYTGAIFGNAYRISEGFVSRQKLCLEGATQSCVSPDTAKVMLAGWSPHSMNYLLCAIISLVAIVLLDDAIKLLSKRHHQHQ